MFSKIVSQLSLSPSAASQLTFYARRLGQERVSRLFSAIAAVLIIGLQFATIAAPPTAANAASPNDIIYGGVVSKSDLLNRYDGNKELQEIYGYFGVSRADIVASHETTINSLNLSYKSLGRLQHLTSDTAINIDGTTYWQRVLHTWDTGNNVKTGSNYQVFEGTRSSDGGYFAIMLACGNIVVKTNPAPPKPTPPPAPKPTPKPTPLPTPIPTPTQLACLKLTADTSIGQAPLSVEFTGTGEASGQTISNYDFYFGDNSDSALKQNYVTHVYDTPGSYTAYLILTSSSDKKTSETTACAFPITVIAPPASFEKSKTALNLTQNIDATTRPAQAGDQIRYMLMTKNTGTVTENYVVTEHLEDVLEYADVTDPGGGVLQDGVMTWPATAIAPGETLTNSFVVTVKNPIPATPVGTSDKYSYDLNMDNVYGNAVRVAIQPPTPKLVEAASTSLPQTGAGTSTFIVLVVAGLTLFFYFRNRQLAREIKLLRADFTGGM
jgi:LPXTG-motif cell wall-anchored protein